MRDVFRSTWYLLVTSVMGIAWATCLLSLLATGVSTLVVVIGAFVLIATARLLVEHGANVDAIDTYGDTPIVLASWRGYTDVVNLLLDNDADVPVDGHRGEQLIQYSAEKGLDRLMTRLVDGGAAYLRIR